MRFVTCILIVLGLPGCSMLTQSDIDAVVRGVLAERGKQVDPEQLSADLKMAVDRASDLALGRVRDVALSTVSGAIGSALTGQNPLTGAIGGLQASLDESATQGASILTEVRGSAKPPVNPPPQAQETPDEIPWVEMLGGSAGLAALIGLGLKTVKQNALIRQLKEKT